MWSRPIQSFRDLEGWHYAMRLAVLAHKIADRFPPEQRFALGAQVRRSATSVPSNVAEGHAKRGIRGYLQHVRIALGSRAELDTQLELAFRLHLIGQEQLDEVASELEHCGRLLHGLERALAARAFGVATTLFVILPTLAAWLA